MGMLKMSIDFLGKSDIRIHNGMFISLYEKLNSVEEAKNYDKILFDKTGLKLDDFIDV